MHQLIDLPTTSYQSRRHAGIKKLLEKRENKFEKRKLLRVPLDRQDIIRQYYSDGQFRFGERPLQRIDSQTVKPPSNSEVNRMFSRLKFDHRQDQPMAFIDSFKNIVAHLKEFEPPLIDDTQAKIEFVKFFTIAHRQEISQHLERYSLELLYQTFYGKYEGAAQNERDLYENLTYDAANSLEKFLVMKEAYFTRYVGIRWVNQRARLIRRITS